MIMTVYSKIHLLLGFVNKSCLQIYHIHYFLKCFQHGNNYDDYDKIIAIRRLCYNYDWLNGEALSVYSVLHVPSRLALTCHMDIHS